MLLESRCSSDKYSIVSLVLNIALSHLYGTVLESCSEKAIPNFFVGFYFPIKKGDDINSTLK